jgi:hypothetical protein
MGAMSWTAGPARPQPTRTPFSPWGTAVVAYLLGAAVVLVLGFVLGTLGFLVVIGMGLTGDPGDLSTEDLMSTTVLVAIAIGVVGLLVEAWFIHRQGGARPLVAPFVAAGGSFLTGYAVAPLALGEGPVTVLGIAVEIVLLALLIKPRT